VSLQRLVQSGGTMAPKFPARMFSMVKFCWMRETVALMFGSGPWGRDSSPMPVVRALNWDSARSSVYPMMRSSGNTSSSMHAITSSVSFLMYG